MPFIAEGPEQVEAYFMRARYFALKLEITTGLKHSKGSVRQFLCDKYGYKGNKKQVLEQYKADLIEWGLLHDES